MSWTEKDEKQYASCLVDNEFYIFAAKGMHSMLLFPICKSGLLCGFILNKKQQQQQLNPKTTGSFKIKLTCMKRCRIQNIG